MKIGIVSDHRGYQLKEDLKKSINDIEVIDYGTNSVDSVDYPDYAFILGEKVKNKEVDFGVAICGSGIGISIACNKVKGIRCAKVSNVAEAKMTRIDNDANILAFSANTSVDLAKDLIETFCNTPFSNEERHIRRIKKIKDYEDNSYDR